MDPHVPGPSVNPPICTVMVCIDITRLLIRCRLFLQAVRPIWDLAIDVSLVHVHVRCIACVKVWT